MALYLGSSEKLTVVLDGAIYYLTIALSSAEEVEKTVLLLSSDGYIINDVNGVYLIPKEAR